MTRSALRHRIRPGSVACVAMFAAHTDAATERFTVTLHNELNVARPAETIVIPFSAVKERLSKVVFDQVVVRDYKGRVIPSQVTSFVHSHIGPQQFNELIFQHDFAAGEHSVSVVVRASES